jgi:signal transduction histidine kinase
VRRRLVLAIAGVAAAAVVLFALPLALVLQRLYRDESLLVLQRDAVAATRRIDVSTPQHGDPIELPRVGDAVAVYDRSGRRIRGQGPPVADAVVREALRTGRLADTRRGEHLTVAVPLLSGERTVGALRTTAIAVEARRQTERAWLLLAALGAGLVLLAIAAALLLARRLAGPLERLAAGAGRLGQGDFSVRAPPSAIAEVDAVGRALDATAGRLDELVRRERAFTADASHQLRTPLAALRLELEMLVLRTGETEEATGALAQVDRLQATIAALLSVARDAPRHTEPVDLVALAEEAESRWRGTLAAANRPLFVRAVGSDLTVRASPQVLTEILDVLLGNAVTHGAGEVTVTVRETPGSVAVEVADAGAGFAMDPEEAFARRAGAGDGHGIGLALARSLALAEGGRLDVTHAGPGPVIRLLLPAERP